MSDAVVSIQSATLAGPSLAPCCCSTFHLSIDSNGLPEKFIPQKDFDALAERINSEIDDTYCEPLGIICAAGGLCAPALVGLPCLAFAKKRAEKKCQIIEDELQKQIAAWEKSGVGVDFQEKSSKAKMQKMDYSLKVSLIPISAPAQEDMSPETPMAAPVRKRGTFKDKFQIYMKAASSDKKADKKVADGSSFATLSEMSFHRQISKEAKKNFTLDNVMQSGAFE